MGQYLMKITLEEQVRHLEARAKYFENASLTPELAQDMAELDQACIKTMHWLLRNEDEIKSVLKSRPSEQPAPQIPPDPTPPGPSQNLPLEEQMKNAVKAAAIHCKEADFQTFMQAEWRRRGWSHTLSDDPEKRCAHQVRAWCKVKSRSEFGKFERKFKVWQSLLKEYYFWKENA